MSFLSAVLIRMTGEDISILSKAAASRSRLSDYFAHIIGVRAILSGMDKL